MTDDELLIHRAHHFLDRIAIIDGAGTHRYAALAEAAARIAAGLLDDRADLDEARVAYLVSPGFDHVAVQWGIWLAGGIAVPVATNHPIPEIEYLLDDSEPALLIASPEHQDRLTPLAASRSLSLRRPSEVHGATPAPLPTLRPERRALMVYTSGTTGRPKGVITTHANLRAQVATLSSAWGWTSEDRSLHVLPLHHIHGIINALSCALWSGGTVEFAPSFVADTVWDRLASGEVTFFTAVPTIYHRLIAAYDGADPARRARWAAGVRRLRLMLSGSAALPASILERWEEITGHRLLERYGMTEIGMALSNPLAGERRAGTVGVPLPEVEIRLIDEGGGRVPPGTPGQIEVRGPQVFLEYWRQPATTAAAFRGGWFLTGDVARVDDGYYRILGRQSVDIIKSAGYKVSALEIEETLRDHPGVVDCAVVGRPDLDLGERIAAAVVARGKLDLEALRGWAKERLAPYKVPKDFRVVSDLPRNAMGKVTKPAVRILFEP
jgi:malonyl-CoA/methylmalonyl-CoA synthetase